MSTTETYFCLTHHGTILTRDQNEKPFLHEPLADGIPANAARFTLHCASAGPKIAVTARLAGTAAAEPPQFAVLPSGAGRAAQLHLGKTFAHAPNPQGPLHATAKPAAGAKFVFVPEPELATLLHIQNNQWLTASGALIKTGFRPGFFFSAGETESDLRHGPAFAPAPEEADSAPAEITILRDGWKIAGQLRLLRPLIYYATFGRPEIFEQLRWSLRSLAE